MSDNKEKVSQFLADSRLAFINQQNEEALNLATEAIKLEINNPEEYKCAANACMSLGRYNEAIRLTRVP